MLLSRGTPSWLPMCKGSWRCDLQEFFLFCILIGEDDKVGKVDVSISVEVKVTLIAGVAPVQAKVLDE